MHRPRPCFPKKAKAVIDRLGLRKGHANLQEFAATLQDLAAKNRQIVAVTSDSRGSGKLGPFAKSLPDQLVEVGIAEQNLVGITAGLAAAGKKSFGVSPACFLTARSLEQIKNDVCFSDVPATLVGISAGVSYGALGSTHHSLHDLAALRAIANLTILVPGDNFETREAIRAAACAEHPVYVRFGKAAMYDLHAGEAKFEVGKAMTIRGGDDVLFSRDGRDCDSLPAGSRALRFSRPRVLGRQHPDRQAARQGGHTRRTTRSQGGRYRRRALRARRTGRGVRGAGNAGTNPYSNANRRHPR